MGVHTLQNVFMLMRVAHGVLPLCLRVPAPERTCESTFIKDASFRNKHNHINMNDLN